jgi:hypothetical protein
MGIIPAGQSCSPYLLVSNGVKLLVGGAGLNACTFNPQGGLTTKLPRPFSHANSRCTNAVNWLTCGAIMEEDGGELLVHGYSWMNICRASKMMRQGAEPSRVPIIATLFKSQHGFPSRRPATKEGNTHKLPCLLI